MSDKTKIYILRNVEDYSGSNPQNMDRMAWYSSGSYWGPISGVGYLTELTDVVITTPSQNHVLVYNGSQWVNAGAPSKLLGSLIDVNLTSPADKGVIRYESSSGSWIDTLLTLNYLDDVNIPSPQDGWSIFYDSVTSKWVGAQGSGSTAAQLLHVFNETISGTGSDFDTNYGFVESTLRVYYEGNRLANDEFSEKAGLDGFTTTFLVGAGEDLVADYARPTSGSVGSVGNANAITLKSRNVASTAPSDSQYLGWDSSGNEWEPKTIQRVVAFSMEGELSVGDRALRFYYPFSSGSMNITRIRAAVNTAPTGATLQVQLRRWNSSGSAAVGTATVGTSAYTGSNASLSNTYFAAGYWLQISVLQVGSTIAGSDLAFHAIGTLLGVTG